LGGGEGFKVWLRLHSASLLHVHAGICWEGHGLTAAGWLAGVPVVRTEHLPYLLTDEQQQQEYLIVNSMVDSTIVVSDAAAHTYLCAQLSANRLVTIRNGVSPPVPRLPPEAVRSSLRLRPSNRVVLTVARFTAQKGYSELIRAASEIVPKVSGIRFLLVGDGPERRRMEVLAGDLGLSTAVVFLGQRQDVPDLLAAAELFILPSHFEGLPLVILEAMAMGLAIVATRIGGTIEALGQDYPWLSEPGDTAGLAALVSKALENEEARCRLGKRNEARFEAEFQASRMARETVHLYSTLLRTEAARSRQPWTARA
jgi:glycosyltransferase involved in cell wall biosynthesis